MKTPKERVNSGCHRIGLVMGGVSLLASVLIPCIYLIASPEPLPSDIMFVSVAFAGNAVFSYAIWRLIGWVIVGFLPD